MDLASVENEIFCGHAVMGTPRYLRACFSPRVIMQIVKNSARKLIAALGSDEAHVRIKTSAQSIIITNARNSLNFS